VFSEQRGLATENDASAGRIESVGMNEDDKKLTRKAKRAAVLIARAGELLDEVTKRLGPRLSEGCSKRGKRRVYHHNATKERVTVRQLENNRFEADIDGRTYLMPRSLAVLLEVIAQRSGDISLKDELVGWKTADDVRRLLKKRSGRPVSQGALNQRIYNLRRYLESLHLEPDLVQRNQRLGVRFAVKRQSTKEISSDSM